MSSLRSPPVIIMSSLSWLAAAPHKRCGSQNRILESVLVYVCPTGLNNSKPTDILAVSTVRSTARMILGCFLPSRCARWSHLTSRPFLYLSKVSSCAQRRSVASSSAPTRTVFVGDLPKSFTLDELLDSKLHNGRTFGPLERVHVLPEKNCLFLAFMSKYQATRFYRSVTERQLSIGGQPLAFGFSATYDARVATLAAVGLRHFSRTLYIEKLDFSWTEADLRDKLNEHAFVEHVHLNREKDYAFVSFMDVLAAEKVCNCTSLIPANTYGR